MIGSLLVLLLVPLATWLVRRRPGRIHRAWIVAVVPPLLAAEEVEGPPLPLPLPLPGSAPGVRSGAIPERHTVEIGVVGGHFMTCAGVHGYGDLGASYRYTKPISAQVNLTVTAGGYAALTGLVTEAAPALSGGVLGAVGLEHRWVGGSVGVLAGALTRAEDEAPSPVMPTATLRIGPRDVFFIDGSVLAVSPAPLPGPVFDVGAGIAFPRLGNQWEPLRIRAGLSGMGFFVSPTVPVGEIGNLDIKAAFGGPNDWGASAAMRVHFAAREAVVSRAPR